MRIWGSIVLVGLIVTLGGTRLLAQETPQIVINELAWAGSSISTQDEWIELFNPGAETIDIGNWQLTKNTGEEKLMLVIPESSQILAGDYFLIANFDEANSIVAIEPDLVDNAITLSNSSLQIKLYSGDFESEGELIDVAGNGESPLAGDNDIKSSMERDYDLVSWHSATSATNIDDGVPDLATPSATNSELSDPPQITSVVPDEAEVGGILEIEEIIGDNFNLEPTSTLHMIRNEQIIDGTNINIVSETLIDYVIFDITDIELGPWDIKIINPDGQFDILESAILIIEQQPTYDLSSTIRINEIYPKPNTTSNDEFIELYNFGDRAVNLAGWQVDDIQNGGSNPHTINRIIEAEDFLILYKTNSKITLNDTGDSIFLIQPTGFVLDNISYTDVSRGESLSRFPTGFKWSETPTPNAENILAEPELPIEDNPLDGQAEPDNQLDTDPTSELDETDVKSTPEFNQGDILISELYPNPSETQEFIELYNPTEIDIDLSDWRLQDASGKTHIINNFQLSIQSTGNTIIEPDQYIVIVQNISNIYLNNSGGESVTLLDPSNNKIDSVTYPDKALKDVAYVLMDDGGWTWATPPTPGKPNVVVLEDEDEPLGEQAIVVAPTSISELPPSGPHTRIWWGIIFVSFSLSAIVFWIWENKRNYGIANYNYQFRRYSQTR